MTDEFDMAVLSVGLEASPDAVALSEKLGIELDAHRFAKTESFHPVSSSRDGIYVSGSFQAPMAIPRSVTQASTAAAEAGRALIEAKGTLTQTLINEKIKENGLNRIVIAACTPRTHEPLFQDTLRESGLNAHLVEMANIRNQNF